MRGDRTRGPYPELPGNDQGPSRGRHRHEEHGQSLKCSHGGFRHGGSTAGGNPGGEIKWGLLYTYLLTCFPGWTWEYIDDFMTLPRLKDIFSFHDENPPQHRILNALAKYYGIEQKGGGGALPADGLDENGGSLFDALPQG